MRVLETKIPPPLVALITGLSMWLSNDYIGSVSVPEDYRVMLAVAVALLGVGCGRF